MTDGLDEIRQAVRDCLLADALAGEDPAALLDSTPLITGGVLDSIGTVKLVAVLENRFGVQFEAFEMSVEYMNTVEQIALTVQKKIAGKASR